MPTKSGVFISYSRSDGGRYAEWLRDKLQKQHPEIPLWQDAISERAGRDWWLQITEALDRVAYMVVVATPDCLKSETVLKEWRYARQQGVCVLPVQASAALDFGSLPRWMRMKQFANLKIKAQWELFVGDLHRPCETPRVPFMAEDMPQDFVARPEQSDPLIQLLLDRSRERQRNPVAITTALRGAGGFGKTTLAKAICHDERIQEIFDHGILWVTLGDNLSGDRLKAKVKDLIAVISGEDSDFGSIEAAVTRFRELLADRDILMVVDDVWNPADLDPFLQGGALCARLITTRNLDTLPQQCWDVKVDSMKPSQAAELLGKGLPPKCAAEISALARRLGEWPLLLGIVNGVLRERTTRMGQPFPQAVAYVNKALDKRGLTAFDPMNAESRNRAIELTVAVSLELFAEAQRDRFCELAIFPENVDIPLHIVETLWNATGALDELDTEDLCVRLHRHSLLQSVDLATRQLRLHGVMRTYLQTALPRRTDPNLVHAKLADAWGDPLRLPNSYAWRWYAYHLAGSSRLVQLRALLLDPDWLQAKLTATDVTSLTADFDHLPGDEALSLVHGAIRLSAHVIASDPSQFASQVVGRLLPHRDMPAIERFLDTVVQGTHTTWLRPLRSTLHPPGTSLIRTLAGHSAAVLGVALSEDGRRAVSGSDDARLKVWDVESGRELYTLDGHSEKVQGVALSEDGRIAVSASWDKTLKVWDLDRGRELHTLQGHVAAVPGVALSGDGRIAVSASSDKTLKIWDVESGRELHTLQGHSGAVLSVAISEDGRRAVSGAEDKTLKLWDVENACELRTLEKQSAAVRGIAMSRDGRRAVCAFEDSTLKVWDAENANELCTLKGHSDWVRGVAVSGDGRRAISASDDQTLKVWDVESGRELRTLQGHSGFVYGVAVSGDGRWAVSASYDQTLKVWDVESGRELRTPEGHSGFVGSIAVSGDGRRAVSASHDQTLKVWDVKSGCELRTLEGHAAAVLGVALSGDGRIAVSASSDKTLKVWDVEGGCELRTLKGHSNYVNGVAVSGDGRIAVSASSDRTLKVWDVESGTELNTLVGHSDIVLGVALSGDGQRAVSASYDKTLKVWDVERGCELRTLEGHAAAVLAVAISGDGQRAVSASWDHTLKVWDVESGTELNALVGHSDIVLGVALSGGGQRAVSASHDKTLKVWDVKSGVPLATFTCDAAALCCAFINDRRLMAGDMLRRIHFLRLEGSLKRRTARNKPHT